MTEKIWSDEAWEDYLYWQAQDRKTIKDKQKRKKPTRRQKAIARKRNNRVNDYISKTARMIVNYPRL